MVIDISDAVMKKAANNNIVRREQQPVDNNIVDFNADKLQEKISERKRARAKRNLQAAAKKLGW